MIDDRAYRWRSVRAGRYSSESYHSRARARLGNSRMTTRWAFMSPSFTSVVPPRARYRPPYRATVGAARRAYSGYRSASRTSMAPILAAVHGRRRREERREHVVDELVVLLLKARVRDAGHDHELPVRIRQALEEREHVLERRDPVVLAAHHQRRGEDPGGIDER